MSLVELGEIASFGTKRGRAGSKADLEGAVREVGRKFGKQVTVAKGTEHFRKEQVNKTHGCRKFKSNKGLRISHRYSNRRIFNSPRKIRFSDREGKKLD